MRDDRRAKQCTRLASLATLLTATLLAQGDSRASDLWILGSLTADLGTGSTGPINDTSSEGIDTDVVARFDWSASGSDLTETVSNQLARFANGATLTVESPHDHLQPATRSIKTTADNQQVTFTGGASAASLLKVTVAAWVRREVNLGTDYIIYRPNGYRLSVSSTGAVTFAVYTGTTWASAT